MRCSVLILWAIFVDFTLMLSLIFLIIKLEKIVRV